MRSLATVSKRGIVVVRALLSGRHECDGEEVILKVVGPGRARVIYADRCGLDPERGCDGVSRFVAGDIVRLPFGWHAIYGGQLDIDDLEIVGT